MPGQSGGRDRRRRAGPLSRLPHFSSGPGDALITTDPSWAWPDKVRRGAGGGGAPGAHLRAGMGLSPLNPARLEAAMDARVPGDLLRSDPNNPLGTVATRPRSRRSATSRDGFDCVLNSRLHLSRFRLGAPSRRRHRARAHADHHQLLEMAGACRPLRVGAWVCGAGKRRSGWRRPRPNILGSSVFAQRAAIAGLKRQGPSGSPAFCAASAPIRKRSARPSNGCRGWRCRSIAPAATS